jgi:hypothetical protein
MAQSSCVPAPSCESICQTSPTFVASPGLKTLMIRAKLGRKARTAATFRGVAKKELWSLLQRSMLDNPQVPV